MNDFQAHKDMVEMIRYLCESQKQAEYDFVGEQREWHLPRLRRAFVLTCKLFPLAALEAMGEARTPYGDKVIV